MYNNQSILIEHGPGLGDLITLTPALKKLKFLYPYSKINILANDNVLPIISRLPYIDQVFSIQKKQFLGRYRPAKHFLNMNYIVFLQWQFHLALMAKLLNCNNRYGYCRDKYLKYNLFDKYIDSQGVQDVTHRTDFITKQLEKVLNIDLSNDGLCDVSLPLSEEEFQTSELLKQNHINPQKRYVLLAPFGNTARNLPSTLLKHVINFITNKFSYPCIIINNYDDNLAHQLQTFAPPIKL